MPPLSPSIHTHMYTFVCTHTYTHLSCVWTHTYFLLSHLKIICKHHPKILQRVFPNVDLLVFYHKPTLTALLPHLIHSTRMFSPNSNSPIFSKCLWYLFFKSRKQSRLMLCVFFQFSIVSPQPHYFLVGFFLLIWHCLFYFDVKNQASYLVERPTSGFLCLFPHD